MQKYLKEKVNNNFNYLSITATPIDDSDDKNLSWLFNYKLNQLPHLSPDVNRLCRSDTGSQVDKLIREVTASETEESNPANENGAPENSPRT